MGTKPAEITAYIGEFDYLKAGTLTADSITSGAPVVSTSSYVTATNETVDLPNSRRIIGTASKITVTDNGAGSTIQLTLPAAVVIGDLALTTGRVTTDATANTDIVNLETMNTAIAAIPVSTTAAYTSAATDLVAASNDTSPAALTQVMNNGGFSTAAGAVIFPANGYYRVDVSSAYVLEWNSILAATTKPVDTQVRQQVLLNPGAVVQGNGGDFDRLPSDAGSSTPMHASTQESFYVNITSFGTQSIIPRALYTVDSGDWDLTRTVAFYITVIAL